MARKSEQKKPSVQDANASYLAALRQARRTEQEKIACHAEAERLTRVAHEAAKAAIEAHAALLTALANEGAE